MSHSTQFRKLNFSTFFSVLEKKVAKNRFKRIYNYLRYLKFCELETFLKFLSSAVKFLHIKGRKLTSKQKKDFKEKQKFFSQL